MIKIDKVSKSFGNLKALDNFSITIKSGSVMGLVGSNGSGKSTIIRILSGVYSPDSGSIEIDDNKIVDNHFVKGLCCFVSDFPYFANNDTLEGCARLYRSIYPNWDDEKFVKLCGMFPIEKKKRVIKMSKGMQRQVALILALSTCPKYLFLDEIFDGLDPVVRQLVKKLIIDDMLENEMTVVIASHNLRELEDFCDSIGFVHNGKVLLESELDNLKLDLHRIQVAFENELPEDALSSLDIATIKKQGSLYNIVVRGDIDKVYSVINTFNPKFCESVPLTLEEIFVSEMEVAGYDIDNILK
ncbi:MAG: ABC transporter ATP-binding protein [Acutalibacteraceae bacterium]|nr:ABC transporter ATP-binding protein [Acutalibacteraceae bacterium]